MNYLSTIKKTVGSAALIAIGILLPLCFHGIPNAGSIFSPMHIPVLIAGFLFGPLFGLGVGLLTPLLNSLITGMPPPYPVLPPMMVECAIYGAVSGLLFRLIKTKWMYLDLYVSLVVAMLVGRFGGAFTNYLVYIGRGDAYSWSIFVSSYFVTGWPAIVIQLALIPSVVFALFKSRLMSREDRYLFPKKERASLASTQAVHFDPLAEKWAEKGPLPVEKASQILAPLGELAGKKVLDVGCGTGVLDPYLSMKAASVTAVDVAPEMIREARKLALPNVEFVSKDFLAMKLTKDAYDLAVVYNAYPHFIDVDRFAEQASYALKKGGRLLIAFDQGRESLNEHHLAAQAAGYARKLASPKEEAFTFWKQFSAVESLDDIDRYYLLLEKR